MEVIFQFISTEWTRSNQNPIELKQWNPALQSEGMEDYFLVSGVGWWDVSVFGQEITVRILFMD